MRTGLYTLMQKKETKFEFSTFLNLIRALFPSWNFFDRVGYRFELEFLQAGSKEWEPLLFISRRMPMGFLINSDCNLKLAQVNVIEHFARDVQELQSRNELVASESIQALTSFKLLRSLIQIKLQDYELESNTIQFRVIGSNQNEKIVIFISDWIAVSLYDT